MADTSQVRRNKSRTPAPAHSTPKKKAGAGKVPGTAQSEGVVEKVWDRDAEVDVARTVRQSRSNSDSSGTLPSSNTPLRVDEGFWKYATYDAFGIATVGAWEMKEGMNMSGFSVFDGEVVDLLESLGTGPNGRIDFSSFAHCCQLQDEVLERKNARSLETAAAFEAMGGQLDGSTKVEQARIKQVFDEFEIKLSLENGGEEVGYNVFSEFLKAENEDINVDSNLHSSGEPWLRRYINDVREIHETAVIPPKKELILDTSEARRITTKNDIDDTAEKVNHSQASADPFARMKWLEALSQAMTARQKALQEKQKEKQRRRNLSTVRSREGVGLHHPARTKLVDIFQPSRAQPPPGTRSKGTRSRASRITAANGMGQTFPSVNTPSQEQTVGLPIEDKKGSTMPVISVSPEKSFEARPAKQKVWT